MTGMEIILLAIVAAVVGFTAADMAARTVRRRRARRQAAEVAGMMQGLAVALVRPPMESVKAEDIKYGDRICWTGPNHAHEHYIAGFDGDPGPSREGQHARPIIPGRTGK